MPSDGPHPLANAKYLALRSSPEFAARVRAVEGRGTGFFAFTKPAPAGAN